ncbi:MAG: hypothetical protein K8T25_22725 [Planctomycetia bacterium]|nr:hypothetical protein [Planctomycetia bacterium]
MLVIAAAMIMACRRRSRILALWAFLVMFLLSILMQPWTGFTPMVSPTSSASDLAYWNRESRFLAKCWSIELGAMFLVLPLALRRRTEDPIV